MFHSNRQILNKTRALQILTLQKLPLNLNMTGNAGIRDLSILTFI
jgi:hypothetical protein